MWQQRFRLKNHTDESASPKIVRSTRKATTSEASAPQTESGRDPGPAGHQWWLLQCLIDQVGHAPSHMA